MKNNKGISMITLVITVICMVIFLSIAFRTGSRYISKSNEEKKNALVSIMSSAAERRQNDKFVGLGDSEIFYSGYHMSSGDFEKASSYFEKNDTTYEPGLWYVIDSKGAKELGITDSEKFLVNDLNNISEDDKGKYIAIVDYFTGKVELIYYADLKITIDNVTGGVNGHVHVATVASCTEPSVCTMCGTIVNHALGHNFNHSDATCTEDKKCTRCGYIAAKALGHEYGTELKHDENGHFNECIRCSAIGNYEMHIKTIGMITDVNDWRHTVYCDVCGYSGHENCEKDIKAKNKNVHTIYCKICLKEQDVSHDAEEKYRYIDKENHMVYCETCKSDIREEEHVDLEIPYGICDKCNGIMDIDKVPEIISLTMENATPSGENKYWAKKADIIKVTIKTNMVLAAAPKIEIQGVVIAEKDIKNTETTNWTATINTQDYDFNDTVMNIKVSNVRSVWGVVGTEMTATTDGMYITYDSTKPKYTIINE